MTRSSCPPSSLSPRASRTRVSRRSGLPWRHRMGSRPRSRTGTTGGRALPLPRRSSRRRARTPWGRTRACGSSRCRSWCSRSSHPSSESGRARPRRRRLAGWHRRTPRTPSSSSRRWRGRTPRRHRSGPRRSGSWSPWSGAARSGCPILAPRDAHQAPLTGRLPGLRPQHRRRGGARHRPRAVSRAGPERARGGSRRSAVVRTLAGELAPERVAGDLFSGARILSAVAERTGTEPDRALAASTLARGQRLWSGWTLFPRMGRWPASALPDELRARGFEEGSVCWSTTRRSGAE